MWRWFYGCGFVCLEQLFYLSVEAYLGSSTKEARALAPQICSHFLDPDAVSTDPLRRFHFQTVTCRLLTLQYLLFVAATENQSERGVPERYRCDRRWFLLFPHSPPPCNCCQMCDCASVFPSESRLHAQEDIRGPLSELQQQFLPDIQDQIQDYRYSKEIKVLHWESGSGPCWR